MGKIARRFNKGLTPDRLGPVQVRTWRVPTLTAGSRGGAACVNIGGKGQVVTVTRINDSERAGRWLRVSTLAQDERNQEPDVDGWITSHGYEPAECGPEGDGTYRLKASASKGRQQEMLDRVVEDMRENRLDVLVVWKSNRIERRGAWNAFDLARKVRDAGGRIEYVQDAYLNDANSMSDVMLALAATKDKQYSEDLRENALRNVRLIKANDGVFTCLPWGYLPVGPKLSKKAVPSDVCREYWPKVLERCIAGDSCRTIAAWLDAEGVKTIDGGKWDEGVVRRLIRNPVYCGRRLGWNGNAPLLISEAVVPVDMWVKANEALKNRPRRGPRSPRKNPVKPMLASLKCPRCDSPMWRIHAGSRDRSKYYYRCAGSGPQRKGCGNMVPLERLETRVVVHMLTRFDEPNQDRNWSDGTNWDAEIADTVQSLQELPKGLSQGELTVAEYNQRHAELMTQLAEYQQKNEHEAISGGWEYTDVLNDDGSVMTQGQYFFSLDREGRREYLKTHDIRAEKSDTAADSIRLVIDGEECEPNPFEAALLTTVPPELLRAMLESQIPNAAEWQALLHGERVPGSELI
jgi:site-specific DNA recombinase